MAWPQSDSYSMAIQNPGICFADDDLKRGVVETTLTGLPRPRSGTFADVYKVERKAGREAWALKCFTRKVTGLQERYGEIARELNLRRLPFMVEFEFLNRGILVEGLWYPALKMRWVDGVALNEFVRDSTSNPKTLRQLAKLWLRLAKSLRRVGIAHGDLQHGNVLLVQDARQGQFHLKLIDYDGMFVPSLSHSNAGEVGHPNFQHPDRVQRGVYDREIDRFSHLVVFTALSALMKQGKQLWDRYDNDENLLFREADFRAPATSPLFQELWKMESSSVHALTGRLILASVNPLEELPMLEEIVQPNQVLPLTDEQESRVNDLLKSGRGGLRRVPRLTKKPQRRQRPSQYRPPESGLYDLPSSSGSTTTPSRAQRKKTRMSWSVSPVTVAIVMSLLVAAPLGWIGIKKWYRPGRAELQADRDLAADPSDPAVEIVEPPGATAVRGSTTTETDSEVVAEPTAPPGRSSEPQPPRANDQANAKAPKAAVKRSDPGFGGRSRPSRNRRGGPIPRRGRGTPPNRNSGSSRQATIKPAVELAAAQVREWQTYTAPDQSFSAQLPRQDHPIQLSASSINPQNDQYREMVIRVQGKAGFFEIYALMVSDSGTASARWQKESVKNGYQLLSEQKLPSRAVFAQQRFFKHAGICKAQRIYVTRRWSYKLTWVDRGYGTHTQDALKFFESFQWVTP